jgi:hypothetical protein
VEGIDIFTAQGQILRSLEKRSVIEVDDLLPGVYVVVARDLVGRPIARTRLIRQ